MMSCKVRNRRQEETEYQNMTNMDVIEDEEAKEICETCNKTTINMVIIETNSFLVVWLRPKKQHKARS